MFLTHINYVNPEIILQDDNIAIQGCDDNYVWFAKNEPQASSKQLNVAVLLAILRLTFTTWSKIPSLVSLRLKPSNSS